MKIREGTRFLLVAGALALLYWPARYFAPQALIGEIVADLRFTQAALAAVLFSTMALVAVRSSKFGREESYHVATATVWTSLAVTGFYSVLAREFGWPMTAASSAFLGWCVWISFLAAVLHTSSLLRGQARWAILATGALGVLVGVLAWQF